MPGMKPSTPTSANTAATTSAACWTRVRVVTSTIELTSRFGRDVVDHRLPGQGRHKRGRGIRSGMDDQTIDALGKLSKALETTERARGHLYSFHQLTGS